MEIKGMGEIFHAPQKEITTPASDSNFVTRVRELVSRILSQLSRISDNDRTQVERLKHDSRAASKNVADMYLNMGNTAPWVAGISFAISLSQFMIPNPNASKMVEFLAGHVVPKGGDFTMSRYQAKQAEYSGIRDLANSEISNKTSKTQSESGSKNEVLQLLNSTLEVLKRASSPN